MSKKMILGVKEHMTQFFNERGIAYPATVISAGPTTVLQVKTSEKDGYSALQIGYGEKRVKNVSKALQGHFRKAGGKPFRYIRELRRGNIDPKIKIGDTFSAADLFEVGDNVTVSGSSKGKGFQGVVKRHGFAGGPRTHGQKHSEREPGSIGATGPQRVFKGKKMAGRMGGERVTVKNLKVLAIDHEENQILVSGAVPGRRGTLLEIRG